jgi:hypothetical protein
LKSYGLKNIRAKEKVQKPDPSDTAPLSKTFTDEDYLFCLNIGHIKDTKIMKIGKL